MKLTDEQIEQLLLNSEWGKVKDALIDVVESDEATFHDYAAFVDAVASSEDKEKYPLAFDCFIKANSCQDVNKILLRGLYLRIEEIIKVLGLKYFDNENSHNIKRDFYLRARFMLFIMASKYNDALNAISLLIKEKGVASYYFQRSKLYVMQKQYKSALEDLTSAIELSPMDSLLYYHRAILRQRLRDIQGALLDFDTAINNNQNNYTYYLSRGLLYEDIGKYKNALDDFKKSIQLNPKNVQGFQEFAWCKYKMNRYHEALSFANIALQLDTNNASTLYIKGCINNALQNYKEASEELGAALKLDNFSNKLWSSKLYYQKAWAEFKLENFTQAQSDISNAIKLAQRILPYHMLAMDIEFFGTKNYYNAKGICQEILKLAPENKRAVLAMQEISQKLA